MSGPPSIPAGDGSPLQAVKRLYGFIDSLKDAPDTLECVSDDLKSTESMLKGLCQYLEPSPQALPAAHAITDQKSALRSVISQFEKRCENFHKELERSFPRSAGGGKLRWSDRVMMSLKNESIDNFQEELSKTTQDIGQRVKKLKLLTAEQQTRMIHNIQQQDEMTAAEISQQLESIGKAIKMLHEPPNKPPDVLEETPMDQVAAPKDQLRLCQENRGAADGQVRYKQQYGSTRTGDNARNIQVLNLDGVQGPFHLTYGDTETGNGSWIAQGVISSKMFDTFFYGPARGP